LLLKSRWSLLLLLLQVLLTSLLHVSSPLAVPLLAVALLDDRHFTFSGSNWMRAESKRVAISDRV
jgi:hypothetical protein